MTIVDRPRVGMGSLVEREDALAALHGSHSEALATGGRLVLVSGEAGIGKTVLVRSFCDAQRGARVLSGACDPLFVPRPLGPFLDVASRAGNGLADRIRSATGSHDVFVALCEEVGDDATVLVLEDIQWADEATLDVLRLVGRRLADVDCLVVATYRDEGLERTHPLRHVLGELATEPRIDRIRLEPLTESGVARLAEGAEVDVGMLHRATSGNPFYVTEALATGGGTVPETIRAAVLARTSGLDTEAMSVLETASVSAPHLDERILERLPDLRAEAVDACLGAGVLVVVDGGVAFRHELARLVVEETLSPTRRRELHRKVLVAGGGVLDPARLAEHAEAAGDARAVLAHAPEAGRRAAATGAYREAAAQYARALRFSSDLGPGDRADLLEGRSRACYQADDQVEAIAVVREAIEYRRLQDAPLQEARALTELADYLYCRGLLTEGDEAVDRAWQLVEHEAEGVEHAYVLDTVARTKIYEGAVDEGIELADRAIAIGEGFGDTYVAGHARVTAAIGVAAQDLDLGTPMIEEAVGRAIRDGELEVAARGLNDLGLRAMSWSRYELAAEYLDRAIELCAQHTQDLWRINALALAARVALVRNRWDDASRYVREVLEDARDSPWPHHEVLCVLALVRARRGDPGARDALADAEAVGVSPEETFAHIDLAAARAEVAWTERDVVEIDVVTRPMLDAARTSADTEAVCRLSFWRHLAGLEVGVPTDARGPYALALVGNWEDAAAEWTRSEHAYEAMLAQSQSEDVEKLRETHAALQRLGARPLATMVARSLRERGVRDLPRGPRASTLSNEAELTARELEVLALLAEGLRNADIAERLVVSRKTVDHHVSAILRKLEVANRGKAVAEAARLGLLQDR